MASPSGRSRSVRAPSASKAVRPAGRSAVGWPRTRKIVTAGRPPRNSSLGVGQRDVEVGDAAVQRGARRGAGDRGRGADQLHLVADAQTEGLVGQHLPGPGRQLTVGQLRPPQPVGLDPEHVHVDDAVEVDRGVRLQEARDLLHAGDRGHLGPARLVDRPEAGERAGLPGVDHEEVGAHRPDPRRPSSRKASASPDSSRLMANTRAVPMAVMMNRRRRHCRSRSAATNMARNLTDRPERRLACLIAGVCRCRPVAGRARSSEAMPRGVSTARATESAHVCLPRHQLLHHRPGAAR